LDVEDVYAVEINTALFDVLSNVNFAKWINWRYGRMIINYYHLITTHFSDNTPGVLFNGEYYQYFWIEDIKYSYKNSIGTYPNAR
jgi:hypothetical protein